MRSQPRFKRRILPLMLGLSLMSGAHAFKLDTHLWIGQQVINDLADDGKISVKIKGRALNLDVPADVKNAILANKTEYLLGHLGPDVAPDVLVGQTVMHPGLENGWKADNWMQFLLDNSRNHALGKAYSYGYLGHAAGDMFAHTYVNQYAGDIFELKDETLVEQRHLALEAFISRYTPPLQDHTGRMLGAPVDLLKPGNGYGSFVSETLVMNDVVQQQYAKLPTSRHLWAYHQLRKTVDAAAKNPAWEKIDAQVLRIFASYWGVDLSTKNAQAIVAKANEIIPKIQRGEDNVQALANDINTLAQRLDNAVFREMKNATQALIDINAQVAQAHIDILNKEKELRNLLPCPNKYLDPVGHYACKKSNEELDRINNLVRQALTSLNATLKARQERLLATAVALRDTAKKTENLLVIITNAHIDFGQRMGQTTSPIKSALLGWRNDIDVAMREYVKATTQSMLNTTNRSDVLAPLRTWFDCYHLSIMGLPREVSGCEIRNAAQDAFWAADRLVKLADDLNYAGDLLGLPSPSDIRKLRDELVQQAKEQVKDAVAKKVEDMLPQDVRDLLTLFHRDMDDNTLNAYFSKSDASGKNLIMIGDMAARARAEMYVSNGSYFDPQRFAAVYNSVLLAKLALLDKAGLQQLAQQAGVGNGSDGKPVFAETENILAGALTNLDGNHQWMHNPPPRPNALGYNYRATPSYASAQGFAPWRAEARDSLFRALFIGPLSPGMEVAAEIGMSQILPPTYPYRPCAAWPFPDDQFDSTCKSNAGPGLRVQIEPQTLVAGQPFSVSWSSPQAAQVSYRCSSGAGGFSGTASLAASGSISGVASAAWVGNPSNCVWTASGPSGQTEFTHSLSTVPASAGVQLALSSNAINVSLPAPGAGSAVINVSPSGGSGNYSFAWSRVSGNRISVSGGQQATFSVMLGSGESVAEVWRVSVKDGQGHVSSRDVNVSFSAPQVAPSVYATLLPGGALVGQSLQLNWSTAHATSLAYQCSASGTGFAGSGVLTPVAQGGLPIVTQAAWVGYPSTCVLTASGPGGNATQQVVLKTYGPAPQISFAQPHIHATFRGANAPFRGTASRVVAPLIQGSNPPYTLQWRQTGGDPGFTVENNTQGGATVSRYLGVEETAQAAFEVTVIDAAGQSAKTNLSLSFESLCGGTRCNM
ncbi:hypothetical protein V8J88_15120 [Massilia sp. W12]|uniref:hypothetical protein n=1 Tax=Massilia sp. W12 TaxID=3126507 RepID=UPI0030D1FABE